MNGRYHSLDTNNKLIWNFRDIGHILRHNYEGKGSQKRVLMILKEVTSITQRDLTERLGIQPGSASEVIGKLEAAGLIVRMPSQSDRRTADLRLTKAGEEAAEAAYAKRQERHEKMFACLTEAEKQMLLGLLEKVNDSWEQEFQTSDMRQDVSEHRKGHGHRCRK